MRNLTAAATVSRPGLQARLVDPSLFTAPYDAALSGGLLAAGVQPRWATRPLRPGDRPEISPGQVDAFFYRRTDHPGLPPKLRAAAKGFAHLGGLLQLLRRVRRERPDVVHFQWTVLPPFDAAAIALLRRWCPVVVTVHDTVAFNGERISLLHNLGFDWPARLADRVIVHTQAGRARLLARGFAAERVVVVPHGPVKLHAEPTPNRPPRDPRHTFVLFGEMKPYKGLDLMIEALGKLGAAERSALRVVIAGRPRMDIEPLQARATALGLDAVVEWRCERQSEQQMADLFADADTFVFPYRQIDASGVYFLVKGLGKWMVASRVGIFAEDLREGIDGELVAPGDPDELARALVDALRSAAQARLARSDDSWETIGQLTRRVYEDAGARLLAATGARPNRITEVTR